MKSLTFLFVIFGLLGCQSEIDKCVEAGLKATEAHKLSEKERAGQEFGFREHCLKAAAGEK